VKKKQEDSKGPTEEKVSTFVFCLLTLLRKRIGGRKKEKRRIQRGEKKNHKKFSHLFGRSRDRSDASFQRETGLEMRKRKNIGKRRTA